LTLRLQCHLAGENLGVAVGSEPNLNDTPCFYDNNSRQAFFYDLRYGKVNTPSQGGSGPFPKTDGRRGLDCVVELYIRGTSLTFAVGLGGSAPVMQPGTYTIPSDFYVLVAPDHRDGTCTISKV